MHGMIFDIKNFAVHDGDGIRTTVFFKGCPLRCRWCHNPEGLSAVPQIAYFSEKCTACGRCGEVCGAARLRLAGESARECTACGRCVTLCPNEALRLYGRSVTVDDLLPILLADREFYEDSGGGVTLSGGECLLQAAFCAELLCRLKEEGIHTAVDTCGSVGRDAIDDVLPYTDVFLYDLKAVDPSVHRRCTGQDNAVILENLRYLDQRGCAVEVRIPFVPGYNDGEIPAIADLLASLGRPPKVRLLAYHNFAAGRYAALAQENTLPARLPTAEETAAARSVLRAAGLRVME